MPSEVNVDHLDYLRKFWTATRLSEAGALVAQNAGAEDRQQLAKDNLERQLAMLTKDIWPSRRWRALEIGCGFGRLLKPMRKMLKMVDGLDISPSILAQAGKNLKEQSNGYLMVGTGYQIPAPDEAYEFVYCFQVFQHIRSVSIVSAYIREVARVLKTDGYFRLQVRGKSDELADANAEAEPGQETTWNGNGYTVEQITALVGDWLTVKTVEEVGADIWITGQKDAG